MTLVPVLVLFSVLIGGDVYIDKHACPGEGISRKPHRRGV